MKYMLLMYADESKVPLYIMATDFETGESIEIRPPNQWSQKQ